MDSRWDFFVDRALSSLLPLCPNLLSLDLDDCRLLTHKSLLQIAKHCPCLQILSLSDCARLADKDISPIAMFLPDLQVLDLSKLYLLSDEAVTVIATSPRLTKLQVLNLAGTRITADALIALSRGHQTKSLLSLDVSCCYNISVRALEEAIAKKPNHLEIITDSIPHGQVRWEGMHSDASSSLGSHTDTEDFSDMADSEDGLTVSSSSDWETASDASWESIPSESVS